LEIEDGSTEQPPALPQPSHDSPYPSHIERLILCRHAESVFNVQGVLNGDPSVPGGLTPRGEEQARRLGDALRDRPIDLCVTTAFERTIRTADIALAGRDVPRLVMSVLDDPPNGIFELRPGEELRAWRAANGTDVPIPATATTERDALERMRSGFFELAARPEGTIVAVLHGWFVSWALVSAGLEETPGLAVPHELTVANVADALRATGEDVFARYRLP
jgi:broad specificity phosphatase PhoE